MAAAVKSSREVKKLVEVDVQEDVITLTLSKDEAEFLLGLMYRHVTGNSTDSPRKHGNAICDALDDAGVDKYAVMGLGTGLVHFREYPKLETPENDSQPLRVGNRVKVMGFSVGGLDLDGQSGELIEIDHDDREFPYRVELDGRDRWVKSVEKTGD